MVSERLLDVTKDYRGMKIEVSGQFRSYNRHEDSRNKLILSIFVRELQFIDDEDMPEEQSKANQITLDGYVCKQPTYRKTPLGREIADILIAVNRPYGKSDYIPCIAWGRNARFAAGIEVGGHLIIQGRVQSREYTKKISEEQVEKRVAYEVSVCKIDVVEDEA
jgi:single-stranded DNA-binding protein